MRKWITAAVLGLMCVGGAANAQGEGAAGVVKGRQAGMMLSGVAMGAIKASIDAQQAPSTQRFNSRALARWAHAVPGMFPAGSGAEAGVPTHARPEIWSDRAGFEAKAADYAAAWPNWPPARTPPPSRPSGPWSAPAVRPVTRRTRRSEGLGIGN